MAIEIRPFTVTIPAGTALSAGFTQALSMPARVVTQIDIRVPPGPRGEVGFGVGSSGVIVVPYGGASYIVTDDEALSYVLEDQFDSGAWEFFGYNTGAYPHTVRLYFHVQLIASAGTGTATSVPSSGSLSSGSGTDTGSGGTTVPPVVTPPVIAPPVIAPPVIAPPSAASMPLTLPPTLPPPPGQAAAGPAYEVESVMLAPADSGQVWLLDEERYVQLTTQDQVNALSTAGVPGTEVSAALHQALYAATAAVLTIDLGHEVLSAMLVVANGR